MFNSITPPDILQMGLRVSDAQVEDNGDFNEVLETDHDGSEPSPLIDHSSTESTLIRNAIINVLNRLNDPVPFTFGSSLLPMNVNHERINQLEPNPVITCRLLQSTNIPINRITSYTY